MSGLKAKTRKALLAKRKQAHQRHGAEPTLVAQATWLKNHLRDHDHLGAYQPIKTERDPGPLLRALSSIEGAKPALAFPKVPGPDQPLAFFATEGPQDFAPGAFGVLEPLETLPQVNPRVILVPMVGFDLRGYRIGYGGGFYDRTLAALRALYPAAQPLIAVGFAYGGQCSDQPLNFEETDQALDYVMTPDFLLDCTGPQVSQTPWDAQV